MAISEQLPAGGSGIVVTGLSDLIRAFAVANKEVAKDVRTALEQSGEPIRSDASQRVLSSLTGMRRGNLPWYRMRAGVSHGTVGYIVPEQKGQRGKDPKRARPKIAPRIAEQEAAAVDAGASRVLQEFDNALAEVARAWSRV